MALAVLAGGLAAWEPLWEWATTKEIRVQDSFSDEEMNVLDGPVRGWVRVKRGSHERHGGLLAYYVATGRKAIDGEFRKHTGLRQTIWNGDGTVKRQLRNIDDQDNWIWLETKESPPWWWGVKDQTSPSDPQWIADHGK